MPFESHQPPAPENPADPLGRLGVPVEMLGTPTAAERETAGKNAAVILRAFKTIPSLDPENPIHAAFVRNCLLKADMVKFEPLADQCAKAGIRIAHDRDLGRLSISAEFGFTDDITHLQNTLKAAKEAGLQVAGTGFKDFMSGFGPTILTGLRAVAGEAKPFETFEAASGVNQKLTWLAFNGREMNTPENLTEIYRILRTKNIRLEEMDIAVACELRTLFQTILCIEKPDWKGKFFYSERFPGIVQSFTEQEAQDFLRNYCTHPNAAARLSAVLLPQVEDRFQALEGPYIPEAERDRARKIPTRIKEFLADPAMPTIFAAAGYIPAGRLRQEAELAVIVGRNLFARGTAATAESVAEALRELDALRREYGNRQILGRDRRVTIIANNERYYRVRGEETVLLLKNVVEKLQLIRLSHRENPEKGDKEIDAFIRTLEEVQRFATPGLHAGIRGTGSVIDATIMPAGFLNLEKRKAVTLAELEHDVAENKKKALDAVATQTPPRTYFFDGHGGPNAFWLFQGSIGSETAESDKQDAAIHEANFAKALRQRYETFKATPEKLNGDVFYFSACFSQNLVRNIDKELGDTPYRPVFISITEYGQVGYSDFGTLTGGRGIGSVLGMEGKNPQKGPVTIADAIRRQRKADSNISIFVPGTSGRRTIMLQIAGVQPPQDGTVRS